MDYQRIYNEFIADRRAKEAALVESGEYFERHHIVPRSLGGGDEAENLICLTAGDHFFAHLCLAKVHGGNQWAPLNWMVSISGKSAKGYKARRHMFALVRKRNAENIMRVHNMKNPKTRKDAIERMRKNNPMFNAEVRSRANKKRTAALQSPEYRAANSARQKQRYSTPQGREEMRRRGALANAHTLEANEKRRQALLGGKQYNARPVVCLDTGDVYDSIATAVRKSGVSRSALMKILRGTGKTAGGYRWAYA